jgi:hypothetical protein
VRAGTTAVVRADAAPVRASAAAAMPDMIVT